MKTLIFLFCLTYICGCEGAYKKRADDRKVDKDYLFMWTCDKFTQCHYKFIKFNEENNRDSALYYIGKMDAFNEAGKYIDKLKK